MINNPCWVFYKKRAGITSKYMEIMIFQAIIRIRNSPNQDFILHVILMSFGDKNPGCQGERVLNFEKGWDKFSAWEILGGGNSTIFFIFTPNLGDMIQYDKHIIQMGWFNHQLERCLFCCLWFWFISVRNIPLYNFFQEHPEISRMLT